RAHAQRHSFPTRRSSDLDEACAFEFMHGGDEIAKSLQESVALGGIRQGNPHAAGAVELDAQFALLAARVGKVLGFPVFEFVNELDRKSTRLNSSHLGISY